MKHWKKIHTKQILKHPRLSVFEDEVVLPNGLKTTYLHFGPAKHAAQVIAIRLDGKILVQKEYSYPVNEWLYQFPGGQIEEKETILEGANRELAEEANITGKLRQIGWFYIDNRRKKGKFYVFVAKDITDSSGKADDEEVFIDYWFLPGEIDKLIRDGKLVNYSALSAWAIYKESINK
jgi:ADP-ribose pyrophosphatase